MYLEIILDNDSYKAKVIILDFALQSVETVYRTLVISGCIIALVGKQGATSLLLKKSVSFRSSEF